MATKYRKPTSRATDSENSDDGSGVSEHLQLSLPIAELLGLARQGVESLVGEIGLLVLNGLIEDEVEGIVGPRGKPQESRTAYRWGREKGYVVFAGQKIPLERPRVRDVEGNEVSLQRYSLFQDEERLEESVSDRVLRRVSTRDYEGVVDVVCDGYGVKKSSVSRNWKAASRIWPTSCARCGFPCSNSAMRRAGAAMRRSWQAWAGRNGAGSGPDRAWTCR